MNNFNQADMEKGKNNMIKMKWNKKENPFRNLSVRHHMNNLNLERRFTVMRDTIKNQPTKVNKKLSSLMDWYYILRNINDEDLKVICGIDIALYIIFVRYSGVFFFLITLFNFLVFVPIYSSGHPSSID